MVALMSSGEVVEDDGDGDPRAADAGLTMADRWVGRDAVAQVHVVLLRHASRLLNPHVQSTTLPAGPEGSMGDVAGPASELAIDAHGVLAQPCEQRLQGAAHV